MKRLLITGFEPFGGEEINPSWEAVRSLPDSIGEYSLDKLCIPVVFGEAAERVIERAEAISADAVLSVGQAGGRASVTPELVAINLRHAKMPDNAGNQPTDETIKSGGTAAYFSTLPARIIADGIRSVGIPAELSYSAGAYVCNDLLYTLLAHFDGTATRVGFIHVPYSAEQGKEPSLPPDKITQALIAAIHSIDKDNQ